MSDDEDNPTGNRAVSQKLGISLNRGNEINEKFNLIMKSTVGVDKALLGIMAEPTLTDEERIFLSYVLGKLVGRYSVKEVIEKLPELLNTAANIGAQIARQEMGNEGAPMATANGNPAEPNREKPRTNQDIMYG